MGAVHLVLESRITGVGGCHLVTLTLAGKCQALICMGKDAGGWLGGHARRRLVHIRHPGAWGTLFRDAATVRGAAPEPSARARGRPWSSTSLENGTRRRQERHGATSWSDRARPGRPDTTRWSGHVSLGIEGGRCGTYARPLARIVGITLTVVRMTAGLRKVMVGAHDPVTLRVTGKSAETR